MASIHLTTFIAAPLERVFDLKRHIAVYRSLFRKENMSSGAASNLLNRGETISVIGKIGGKTRLTMLKMTSIEKPFSFSEEQVKGDLQNYRHLHYFKEAQNGTIVIDMIEFGMPKDLIGRVIGKFYLKNYLENIICKRNELVRSYAESEKWRAILT